MSVINSIIHKFSIGSCMSDSFHLIPKLRIELKRIKLLQTYHPHGFEMITIKLTMNVIFLYWQILMGFFFYKIFVNVIKRKYGIRKMVI